MDDWKIEDSGLCDYCGQYPERWRHLEHADPGQLTAQATKALLIYADVTDRRGIKQEFYQVDDDITQEILETWAEIIDSHNKPAHSKTAFIGKGENDERA